MNITYYFTVDLRLRVIILMIERKNDGNAIALGELLSYKLDKMHVPI